MSDSKIAINAFFKIECENIEMLEMGHGRCAPNGRSSFLNIWGFLARSFHCKSKSTISENAQYG